MMTFLGRSRLFLCLCDVTVMRAVSNYCCALVAIEAAGLPLAI